MTDIMGMGEALTVTVGRAADMTTTSTTITPITTTNINLLPLEMLFIASLFIFFSHEIWRKWRMKNEKL